MGAIGRRRNIGVGAAGIGAEEAAGMTAEDLAENVAQNVIQYIAFVTCDLRAL